MYLKVTKRKTKKKCTEQKKEHNASRVISKSKSEFKVKKKKVTRSNLVHTKNCMSRSRNRADFHMAPKVKRFVWLVPRHEQHCVKLSTIKHKPHSTVFVQKIAK